MTDSELKQNDYIYACASSYITNKMILMNVKTMEANCASSS